jgi:amino acid adenylation domain-containing protein
MAWRSLVELLEHRAAEDADRTVFTYLQGGVSPDQTLDYRELGRRARAIGALLRAHAKPGARVVLLYPPGLDYISAFFGCLYGGFVAVPAYPPDPSRLNRTLPRLQGIARDAGAEIVLTTSPILAITDSLGAIAPDLATKKWLATDDLAAGLDAGWRRPDVGAETLAFLQYTSGSTGSPKGVMLTHGNLLANERMIQNVFKLDVDSVGVGWLPLYHDMGLIGNVLQTIYVGFHCVLMSPLDFLHRPARWLEAISRFGGTASGGPNFAYDLCVRKITDEDRARLDLKTWQLAFSGAEPVRRATLDRFADKFGDCGFRPQAFLPCFGLAEAALLVCGKTMGTEYGVVELDPAALEEGRVADATSTEHVHAFVSCGPPVVDSRVLIVDPMAHVVCAPDKVGEVWVAGPHVAIGYWNDHEKSESTFHAELADTADPTLKELRFLRTGDLGFLRNGELFICGRLKDLIIIRGRNYYPQDIERVAEESFPTLRRGCVAAFSVQVEGEERLVVAVEVERRFGPDDRRSALPPETAGERRRGPDRRESQLPPDLDAEARQAFAAETVFDAIRRSLADHFSLSVHALLILKPGAIPKTSSGKIQRHACRAGYLEGTLDALETRVPTETSAIEALLPAAELRQAAPNEALPMVEAYLRAAVARVMRVDPERIDMSAPLNGLGLDSLMAVEANHAIERHLGIVLPVTAFLREGTLRDLAKRVLAMLTLGPSDSEALSTRSPPSSSVRGESRSFALSAGQEAFWFLHQLAPESSAYNIGNALRIRGGVLAAALETSLRTLLERHPTLATTYDAGKSGPTQRVRPELTTSFKVNVIDASGWSDAALLEQVSGLMRQPFDLENGPVFRAALFSRSPDDHVLALSAHHIAADLWSIVLLLSELRVIYPAVRTGRGVPKLAPGGMQYRDFVEWQAEYLARDADLDWADWKLRLEGVPPLDLRTDRPRPATQSEAGAAIQLLLPQHLVSRVFEFARVEGATAFTVLLACFEILLARHSGQKSFIVGSPVAGRPRASFGRVVGYFVNPLPLAVDLDGEPTVRAFLHRVRETVLSGLEHQNFPFPRAVERLKQERDPSRSPVFQAMFVLEKAYLDQESDVAMLVLNASEWNAEFAGFELQPFPLPERAVMFDLCLALAQSDGVVRGELLYRTDLFEAATVERMARHFEILLGAMMSSPDTRVSELALLTTEEQHQVLVEWNATEVSYPKEKAVHELFEDQASRTPDAVALVFADETVTYGELNSRANGVAQGLRKRGIGPEELVAVFMDRSVEMVTALVGILKSGAAYVPIDPDYPEDRIAYMLEDSGARVVLTQSKLALRLTGAATVVCLDTEHGLQARDESIPMRVDGSSLAYVIYTSGSTGRPKGAMNTHAGLRNRLLWMQETYKLTPEDAVLQKTSFSFDVSGWEFFWPLMVGARLVIAQPGGHKDSAYLCEVIAREKITTIHFVPSMLQVFLEDPAVAKCTSLTRVICSGEALPLELTQRFFERSQAELHNLYGPTEAAIDVSAWHCKRDGQEASVPIGRPIANTSLYILDERMAPTPVGVAGELYIGGIQLARGYWRRPDLTAERFVANPFGPGRIYKTGDSARFRTDGSIEYLGRLDHQIKLRGFRIELGEIESFLREKEGILDAVVILREDRPGDKKLVAYVVPSAADVVEEDLSRYLAARVPQHMIPAAFVILSEMPLGPTGKLDRTKLPKPARPKASAATVTARNPIEEELTLMWKALLGVEEVGVEDNFFDLGGHSLLLTQLSTRINAAFYVEIPLRVMFDAPTIVAMTRVIADALATDDSGDADLKDLSPEELRALLEAERKNG